MAIVLMAGLEAMMASKDKGGRSDKKVAAKSLKEKRLDKKMKKGAHQATTNQSVDKTFGH